MPKPAPKPAPAPSLLDQLNQWGERNIKPAIDTAAEAPSRAIRAVKEYIHPTPQPAPPNPYEYLGWAQPEAPLPSRLNVYRADPTGKFGGKNGLETQPIGRFSTGEQMTTRGPGHYAMYDKPDREVAHIYKYARTLGGAAKAGVPTMTPEEFATFVLKEGRSDAGHGASIGGTPRDEKYHDVLRNRYDMGSDMANFLATIEQKRAISSRTGIPFAEAWNGRGRNAKGTSGAQYAQDWEQHRKAVAAPENQELMRVIMQGYQDGQKHGLPLRKAAGGAIEIDDGDPAKRRRMI